jgi:hypothetical protein
MARLREGITIQDEVEEFIVSMLDQGYTRNEIIEEIPNVFEGFDRSLASDAYGDYERDTDPSNEEATVGDIEQFLDELEAEGFPWDQAIEKAAKRYKLSVREIKNMVESTKDRPAQQALDYLSNLESSLGRVSESVDDEVELDGSPDEDVEGITVDEAVEILRNLVNEGWDEDEAAIYVVESSMDFETQDEGDALVAEILDELYDSRIGGYDRKEDLDRADTDDDPRYDDDELRSMDLISLRRLADEYGISYTSQMGRDILIDAISDYEANNS